MKIRYWFIALVLLLTACQQPPASAVPATATNTAAAAATSTQSASVSAPATIIAVTAPAKTVVHRSSSDPNAPNLIVVRDQRIVNSGVTMNLVRAAQAGWLAIYLSKNDRPGHLMGYAAVPAGDTKQLKVPLDPNSGVSITEAYLAGRQLFALLQSGSKAPGTPVEVNGRSVLQAFTVLASNP